VILLQSIQFLKHDEEGYPFHLPFFNQEIQFTSPITILIGDNGSGKSTFLELIRSKLDLFQIGTPYQYPKAIHCKTRYILQKPKGFYFSSEDFTTYIHELEKEKVWSKSELDRIDIEYANRSTLAKTLASMPHQRTIHEIESLHNRPLQESSHGEAYLSFFQSRMREKQLILLDEPETPLSFQNQMALLYLLKQTVDSNSQLIIATHSPVIMAYPGANILHVTKDGFQTVRYQDIEQVQSLKQFLNHPEQYFRHLFQE